MSKANMKMYSKASVLESTKQRVIMQPKREMRDKRVEDIHCITSLNAAHG